MNILSIPRLAALAAASLLASCGGGADTGPSVSSMAATNVGYGKTVTISVSGTGLNANIQGALEPGCFAMTRSASTSDTAQAFTCQINAMGDLRFHVRTAEGGELGSLRLTVDTPQVSFTATQGTVSGSFVVELDPISAPKTVDNFLRYVNVTGGCFYKGTIFHRVIKDFVVQGGGFGGTPTYSQANTYPAIAIEKTGLKNVRGSLAMARVTDPNSATSQFYVNVVDNASLDYVSDANPGYAVFGKVVSGMDTIDLIRNVPVTTKTGSTSNQTFENIPETDVTITACSQTR